jgi:hypothetical protein
VLYGILPFNAFDLFHRILLDKLGDVNEITFLLHAHLVFLVELEDDAALPEEVDALRLTQEHNLKFASFIERFQEICQLFVD